MAKQTRKDLEALYQLFDHYALNDQRKYYDYTLRESRDAAKSANKTRAFFALLAGSAAALAGLFAQVFFADGGSCSDSLGSACGGLNLFISVLIIIAVVSPAVGAFFSSLSDLFQWDRLTSIYDDALENLEVADAQSPLEEMGNMSLYKSSLHAYAGATLSVMQDETAQWGQAIRTPEKITQFVEDQQRIADEQQNKTTGEQPSNGGEIT